MPTLRPTSCLSVLEECGIGVLRVTRHHLRGGRRFARRRWPSWGGVGAAGNHPSGGAGIRWWRGVRGLGVCHWSGQELLYRVPGCTWRWPSCSPSRCWSGPLAGDVWAEDAGRDDTWWRGLAFYGLTVMFAAVRAPPKTSVARAICRWSYQVVWVVANGVNPLTSRPDRACSSRRTRDHRIPGL